MNKNYYAVIMAGGVGSRFWPMSTQKYPKQFHDMLGTGDSLIQKTFSRLERLIPTENILISTNKRYKKLVKEHLENVTTRQLLLEPCMRNTSPCILYAALKIHTINPDGVMIIAPSDHWIENEPQFIDSIETAFEFCQQNDVLMTLGIQPNSPNTGYGYIQFENTEREIKKVKQFTEKPDLETAKKFVESGEYLWNAGIFIWSVKSILKAFKTSLPEMSALFCKGNHVYNTEFEDDFINTNYDKAENVSIDYGILEKATNVHVLPVNFNWNDLGTWSSLYNKLPKDDQQNASVGGKTIFRNASNNMVRTQNRKRVVIQGLNNYIVIEKDDVLLICPKSDEQEIKQITSQVKEDFGEEFV
ncbi:MAG: mannose-1-phosphate guanylyltransferase [Flavobacteriaceae bacterium]|nr:mannose-1-phosphate guanylyltransferase [Flavobacteriaceae bacterium]